MFKKGYLFWLTIFLSLPIVAVAQTSTSSPYSSRGIGLWEDPSNGVYGGMGGARISSVDSAFSNDYNPASYSYLGKGMPLVSFGLNGQFSSYASQSEKGNARAIYISEINIAIPFAKRFGLAIGMRPVLKRGYNFHQYADLLGDSIKYSYLGNGQVQQAYLGFSVAPLKNDRHFLSFGLEGAFNFGSLNKIRVIEFINTTGLFNASDENSYRIRAFSLKAGAQYRYTISDTRAFSIGAIYQPQMKWNATKTDYLYRFAGVYGVNNGPGSVDTMYYVGDDKGSITIPQRLGVGFTWEMKGREDSLQHGILHYRLRFSLDYELMSCSNYSLNFLSNSNSDTSRLSNAQYIRFGIDFTPHHYFTDSKPNINYMSKVNYRIGFRYGMLPTPINTKQTQNIGVTFGMGFPIPIRNASSSINFGVTLGQQGAKGPNSIQEKFVAVQLGIVLSPGSDRWFRKYKYD